MTDHPRRWTWHSGGGPVRRFDFVEFRLGGKPSALVMDVLDDGVRDINGRFHEWGQIYCSIPVDNPEESAALRAEVAIYKRAAEARLKTIDQLEEERDALRAEVDALLADAVTLVENAEFCEHSYGYLDSAVYCEECMGKGADTLDTWRHKPECKVFIAAQRIRARAEAAAKGGAK